MCILSNNMFKTLLSEQSVELFLNRASMVSLLIFGAIFIYEGAKYISMKQRNPDISDKIYAAAILAILLGIAEIVFAIAHLWM